MNADAFELNKIAGGILFALLVFFSLRTASDIIFRVPLPETPGYDVAVTEDADAGAVQDTAEKVPLAELLQTASLDGGASQAKKCVACHTFEQGGANKVGPNLYGVLDREVAAVQGFAYSPALQGLNQKGVKWDYEALSDFILNPRGFAPGTKMAFAGIRNDKQRADMIVYLREHTPNPPPLPTPEPQKPAEATPAAPAVPQQPVDAAPATPQQPADAAPATPAPTQQQTDSAPGPQQPASEGQGQQGQVQQPDQPRQQ